jgi:cytochrome P450
LAKYPEELKKVREEIDRVLGDRNEQLTIETLNKLEYLTMCIKEVKSTTHAHLSIL